MREPAWVTRLARKASGMPQKFSTLPGWSQRSFLGMGLFALVVFAFLGIVAPLFATSQAIGEVDGQLPLALNVGRMAQMQLAVDNTGDSAIQPVCLAVTTSPGVSLDSVDFQGIETINFTPQGIVCGGTLATQETISISVNVTPHDLGPVEFVITPRQGAHAIGSPLTGQVQVVKTGGI